MSHNSFLYTALTASVLIGVSACSSDTREESFGYQQQETLDHKEGLPLLEKIVVGENITLARTESVQTTQQAKELHHRNQVSDDSAVGSEIYASASNLQAITQAIKPDNYQQPENRERYADIDNHATVVTSAEATSTFSIDVDTGSYANVRRYLNTGTLPPQDAIRIEEMINYFDYHYTQPENVDTPFSITTEIAETPWNDKTHLLHIGLNGYDIDENERPAANLVFLIDVSGSMSSAGKLGLVKPAMQMLVNQLNENDKVSIVVYAGHSGVVLEPTAGNENSKINQAIQTLQAGGSTNGQAGIELAYTLAEEHMGDDTANRVILVTDGDFNVGVSNTEQLKALIKNKRKAGIALSTLGFGQGNYNDHLLEQLADVGNGAYAYIDTLNEARKVLSEELTGTLLTIAKDVKIQMEFNPAVVSEYRLIGYENRALANEDFTNDKVDAGEIGAGHTVTALYEIALVGSGGERNTPRRYPYVPMDGANLEEVAELRIRYKKPDAQKSLLISQQIEKNDIQSDVEEASEHFKFSAAVAAFGQYLRDGKYLNDFSLENTRSLASVSQGDDAFGYRLEFMNLVRLAQSLGDISENSNELPRPKDYRG